jgi:hypothetical protein
MNHISTKMNDTKKNEDNISKTIEKDGVFSSYY